MPSSSDADRIVEILCIWGRVHGVGFRAFAKAQASRFGVTGTVENRPDGTVLVEAFGRPEEIETFVRELWKGPSSLSRVDRIDRTRRTIPGPVPLQFEIRVP